MKRPFMPESLIVASEHVAWLMGQGMTIRESAQSLGIVGYVQDWTRVISHVARQWESLKQAELRRAA